MTEPPAFGVWMHGKQVGTLLGNHNVSSFYFDSNYTCDSERSVLGLAFEQDLNARFTSNVRLPVWFSNLLPEGVLRDWVAQERGVSPSRELELLTQVGRDLPGAVEILPMGDVPTPAPNRAVYPSSVVESVEAAESVKWRFSLAGVGLKFSMLRDSDRFTCPANGAGGDWIVKLPDKLHRGVPENEFLMMSLASVIGIDVPEITMVHRDEMVGLPVNVWPAKENLAFAIRRFDRDEHRAKIHIEDLAQVRSFYPEDKYLGNFETVASLIYRGVDEPSLIEFVKRLALNILIGNGDAHLKNWSLIYLDQQRPTISPAYDIVATGLYVPQGEVHDLGLKFGGSRRFQDVRLRTFRTLGDRLGSGTDLGEVADETISRALVAWADLEHSRPIFEDVRKSVSETVLRHSISLRRC